MGGNCPFHPGAIILLRRKWFFSLHGRCVGVRVTATVFDPRDPHTTEVFTGSSLHAHWALPSMHIGQTVKIKAGLPVLCWVLPPAPGGSGGARSHRLVQPPETVPEPRGQGESPQGSRGQPGAIPRSQSPCCGMGEGIRVLQTQQSTLTHGRAQQHRVCDCSCPIAGMELGEASNSQIISDHFFNWRRMMEL